MYTPQIFRDSVYNGLGRPADYFIFFPEMARQRVLLTIGDGQQDALASIGQRAGL